MYAFVLTEITIINNFVVPNESFINLCTLISESINIYLDAHTALQFSNYLNRYNLMIGK